ncbi:uncharacterized protein V6R79_022631 [Siganus canaliculatus]
MAKRRAEDTLLHDSPPKIKCCRSLCGVELRLGSMAPVGGVSLSSPSLLALLGSRSRKRPYYFEDVGKPEEAALYHNIAHYDDVRKRAGDVSTMQTSGSSQDRRSFGAALNCKKRPREEPDSISAAANDTVVEDASAEDCTYNSFQYWRSPLPDLDLSLLEDVNAQCPSKDKSKDRDFSLDAMET